MYDVGLGAYGSTVVIDLDAVQCGRARACWALVRGVHDWVDCLGIAAGNGSLSQCLCGPKRMPGMREEGEK